MKFTPPLSDREDFDLILIAKNDNNSWQPEASELAYKELINRGMSAIEIDRLYQEILEDGKREYEAIKDNRKTEDYNLFEKFYLCLWWPKTLLFDWDLKSQGYHLKAKRRYQLIAMGMVMWIIFIAYIGEDADKREQELIEKINNVDNSKWEERMIWNTEKDSLGK